MNEWLKIFSQGLISWCFRKFCFLEWRMDWSEVKLGGCREFNYNNWNNLDVKLQCKLVVKREVSVWKKQEVEVVGFVDLGVWG